MKLLILVLAGVAVLLTRGSGAWHRIGQRLGRIDPAYMAGREVVRRADSYRRAQEAKVARYLSFLGDDAGPSEPHLTKGGFGRTSGDTPPPQETPVPGDRPDRRP